MTVSEAIAAADELRENTIGDSLKLSWLLEAEGRIQNEIFALYENYLPRDLSAYTPATPLLVPEPYCRVYTDYLAARTDQYYAESARYNADALAFNEAFEAFACFYKQNHSRRRIAYRYD